MIKTNKPTIDQKNTSITDEILNSFHEAIDKMLETVFTRPKTVDEIIDNYSKNIDTLILEIEHDSKNSFRGGNFTLASENNEYININADLFFQTPSESWKKKEIFYRIKKSKIEEESFRSFLIKKREEYKISHPNS